MALSIVFLHAHFFLSLLPIAYNVSVLPSRIDYIMLSTVFEEEVYLGFPQ
jgi:hypothetical protein